MSEQTTTGMRVLQRAPRPVDPRVSIGHVHLRTADIDRVRAFYVDVMGFDVIAEERDVPGWGTTGDILFLSAGGYHHHLGFNTWKSAGGAAPARRLRGAAPRRAQLSDARGLADALRRLQARRGPSARPPITARTRRSTSPTPTATTSSSRGTGRSTCGRATRQGRVTMGFGDLDLDDLLTEPPLKA